MKKQIITAEEIRRLIDGTDARSLAQSLGLLLTHSCIKISHEITECLISSECTIDEFLDLLRSEVSFAQRSLVKIKDMLKNFDELCEEVRKGCE